MNWQKHIHTEPAELAGRPIVKRTRLSVDYLLCLMAEGWTEQRILENHPQLSHDALLAVFAFEAEMMKRSKM
jgi:uncharacterized protein (DUF433 family)